MTSIFKPCIIIDKFDNFDIKKYRSLGFDTILLDVDNTITPYYEKIPNQNGKNFVNNLKENGFKVIVFSNNTNKRVQKVAESINCDYMCWALKPLKIGFKKAKKKYGIDLNKTICMGDQLITDVLGANRMHVYSIYCKPISKEDSFITSINRKVERFIFKHILHEEV